MIWSKKNKRDGETYWYVRYLNPDGGRKKETVPPLPDGRPVTKQDAKEFLRRRQHEVDTGTWVDPDTPPAAPIVPDLGPTFSEFAKTFLERHPGRRRSNHYGSNIRELNKEFGDRRIREITRGELDAYRVKLQSTARPGRIIPITKREEGGPDRLSRAPLSPTTVLKRLRALQRIFKMAVRWDVIDRNPAAELEKPSAAAGKIRYLTREEFDRLEATAPPWLQPMIRFGVVTGMRLKEIATLRWDDVDFNAGLIHVPQDTKTGTRVVPMNTQVKEILKKRRDRGQGSEAGLRRLGAYVFTEGDGATFDTENQRAKISDETVRAARGAGLDKVGFHTLRHTAATWMVQARVPLYEVQNILGHSTPTVTAKYAHFAPADLAPAIQVLDNVFMEKAKV